MCKGSWAWTCQGRVDTESTLEDKKTLVFPRWWLICRNCKNPSFRTTTESRQFIVYWPLDMCTDHVFALLAHWLIPSTKVRWCLASCCFLLPNLYHFQCSIVCCHGERLEWCGPWAQSGLCVFVRLGFSFSLKCRPNKVRDISYGVQASWLLFEERNASQPWLSNILQDPPKGCYTPESYQFLLTTTPVTPTDVLAGQLHSDMGTTHDPWSRTTVSVKPKSSRWRDLSRWFFHPCWFRFS